MCLLLLMDSSPSLTVLNRWHKREIVFSHRWRVYRHNVKCVLVTQNKYHVFLHQRNKDDHLSQFKKHPLYSILKINNIVDHRFAIFRCKIWRNECWSCYPSPDWCLHTIPDVLMLGLLMCTYLAQTGDVFLKNT